MKAKQQELDRQEQERQCIEREVHERPESEVQENESRVLLSYLGERINWLAYESKYSDSQIRQELKDISFKIDKELLK